MEDKVTEYIIMEVGTQVLEMDKETQLAFITGKKEIAPGAFIMLRETKKSFEIT